ncbi:hypothetical protein AB0D14_02030 [Streptomyces sp. NPDC048484]|uniref:hypothetical protein n=1 Tax=Streptomyces sp. NPDC048484 TaxID=3155146 RepID=UPI003430BF7A
MYRDVKLYAPGGLTHREKLTALVLADDANEQTRLTYKSVVDPDLMRQALIRNERDMRKVLARLQDMKVIEHAGGGFKGKVAKFRFLHMDPAGCPGRPGCQCPQAMEVQNEPPLTGGPNRTSTPSGAEVQEVQKEPAMDPKGGSFRHQRRSESDLPTPPTPFTTSPLSVAERLVTAAAVVTDEERETFINWINQTYAPRGPAWWRAVAKEGDFPDIAAKWRANQAAPERNGETTDPCTKCPGAEGWIDNPEGGVRRCPECNPGVAA